MLPRSSVILALLEAVDDVELKPVERRVLKSLAQDTSRDGFMAAFKRRLKALCTEAEVRSPVLAQELMTLFERTLPADSHAAAERLLGMYTILPKFPEMREDRRLVAKKRGRKRRRS